MIRAVLDTNVLASAIAGFSLGVSTPAQLLHQWRAERFSLIISGYIEDELRRTLARPYFRNQVPPEQREAFLTLLATVAEYVEIHTQVAGVATHPEDDPILATALSARVDYLVTGDRALREHVRHFHNIPLVSPAEFLNVLSRTP
jgi:uncharacterized protein